MEAIPALAKDQESRLCLCRAAAHMPHFSRESKTTAGQPQQETNLH